MFTTGKEANITIYRPSACPPHNFGPILTHTHTAAFLKAIFDKWSEFRDSSLEHDWQKLIYGRSGWNSIEKVKERFELVRELESWDELEGRRLEIKEQLEDPSVDAKTKHLLAGQ